jgi:hypothetical protein
MPIKTRKYIDLQENPQPPQKKILAVRIKFGARRIIQRGNGEIAPPDAWKPRQDPLW